MSAWATIFLIITTAALIGVVIEIVRIWLQDDELKQEDLNDRTHHPH